MLKCLGTRAQKENGKQGGASVTNPLDVPSLRSMPIEAAVNVNSGNGPPHVSARPLLIANFQVEPRVRVWVVNAFRVGHHKCVAHADEVLGARIANAAAIIRVVGAAHAVKWLADILSLGR